ncbi:MAG: VOC family protein [Acidimicrobiales bacterium]
MRICGFDHVQLAIPAGGEPAARTFYADVLGLTEIPKPEPLAARGGCWFQGDNVQIHIGADPDFRAARKAHPALLVDDLPALARALEAAGHLVREGNTINGRVQQFVDDPFGNRIELVAASVD